VVIYACLNAESCNCNKLLKQGKRSWPQNTLDSQGKILHEPLNIANEFNNYFSEIGSKIAEKILYQIVHLTILLVNV